DAHHDDEGQHDGVFDRRRAALVLHEADDRVQELTHRRTLSEDSDRPSLGGETTPRQIASLPTREVGCDVRARHLAAPNFVADLAAGSDSHLTGVSSPHSPANRI